MHYLNNNLQSEVTTSYNGNWIEINTCTHMRNRIIYT